MVEDQSAHRSDPMELVDDRAIASALGVSLDEVRERIDRGGLFSIERQGEAGTRYPAFQAWPDTTGNRLEQVLSVLHDLDDPARYIFFVGRLNDLGGLNSAEVLVGHSTLPSAELDPVADEVLAMPAERRLRGVIAYARAFVIEASA